MNPKTIIETICKAAIEKIFNIKIETLEIQQTRKEFEGDYTLVIFPLIKELKGNPELIANQIGNELLENKNSITAFNVVKGFLNLSLSNKIFYDFLDENYLNTKFGYEQNTKSKIMVEYSSPNTNKPLHLGHVRNNVLGFSIAKIKEAEGYKVLKSQIINDRGIHICKSMISYKLYGNNETPENTGLKGDKLIGNYYVKFDQEYQKEIKVLESTGMSKDDAKKQAPILLKAQEMLLKWEEGDAETLALWNRMNSWVYAGFDETYKNLGVDFDIIQYESNTYKLGKDIIQTGLEKGVFYQKEDSSIWCDLTDVGLDEKIVQRSDGTSVYITQDLGTAAERFKDYGISELIYTVGNEQDYHFQVLFEIMKKLGYNWSSNMYHLSYGMVDLPQGKMKSREGTVVDADELMLEMKATAKQKAEELGKLDEFSDEQKNELYSKIGMAALKYYILKVDAKKRILFDPNDSIDFNGNTGPFILYTYARIQSIFRKSNSTEFYISPNEELNKNEKEIVIHIANFNECIKKASNTLNPSLIANYTYDLVKLFNSFYQNHSILQAENEPIKKNRLAITKLTSNTIYNALQLLGIETVERM